MVHVCLSPLLADAGHRLNSKMRSIHAELTYFILSVRTAHRIFGSCLVVVHNLSSPTGPGHGDQAGANAKGCQSCKFLL
jgi:hypothetical protein